MLLFKIILFMLTTWRVSFSKLSSSLVFYFSSFIC